MTLHLTYEIRSPHTGHLKSCGPEVLDPKQRPINPILEKAAQDLRGDLRAAEALGGRLHVRQTPVVG